MDYFLASSNKVLVSPLVAWQLATRKAATDVITGPSWTGCGEALLKPPVTQSHRTTLSAEILDSKCL